MTEIKCFRDAFRDQLHELSGQPNILTVSTAIEKLFNDVCIEECVRECCTADLKRGPTRRN